MRTGQAPPSWPGRSPAAAAAESARDAHFVELLERALLAPASRPRRAPVFIVSSPRARVGCTLIARLLVEFFLLDERPVTGFDVNAVDPALVRFLPDHTQMAAIGDTRSQMALFDRLIVNDGAPKVVDLAHASFAPFFDLMRQIGFIEEARQRGVDPVVLFVTDRHHVSAAAYDMLLTRFPRLVLVPLHNEHVSAYYDEADFPILRANGVPLRIPRLSPVLNTVINRAGFSFAAFLRRRVAYPTEIHAFTDQAFIAFRELELRLMMEDFRLMFQPRA